MPNTGPLSRFRVLDLTRVRSGPTAVRQFADWGADVVMVESRSGSGDISGSRDRSDFQNLNRNKRSLTLDLKSDSGRNVFLRLAARADVLFENFRPDVKRRLGVDYESLKSINPRLVYVSISGFGEDGPYSQRPGLDQIVQGMGGLMSITGHPGDGPVRTGIAVADSSAGLYGALGAMTALLEREVSGEGRWVRTSLLQAQIALLDFQAARYLVEGEVPAQAGNDHPTAVPMGLFESSDGLINIAASGDRMFSALCGVLGLTHLLEDPRFVGHARRQNRATLNAQIEFVTRQHPTNHWVATLNSVGVPCGPVNAMDEVFADEQVRHSGIVQTVVHQRLGTLKLIGQPITMSGLEPGLRKAAPELGADKIGVLSDYGFSREEIDALQADGVI
ncbi:MAG: CoA transferase [Alphaproteobacteria bacterium]|nr:CoA transferase [Alphaproteobacteria bacterium]